MRRTQKRGHPHIPYCCALVFVAGIIAAAADAAEPLSFARDIAPILERRCVRCHATGKAKGDLSVVSSSELMRGGESGVAIIPGKPDESPLLQRVTGPKPDMPAEGPPLTPSEVESLRAWIAEGAVWPENLTLKERAPGSPQWWSFQPVKRPDLPIVQQQDWVRSDVDRFVLEKLEAKGLSPSPEADRRTLIRRLSLDLLGLPPTPEEVAAFVADTAPKAYERLVDRLLASPHYGEHWARHWLDVVRFTESDGFEEDQQRPDAWPYRDYVVNAFNKDTPYNQFVREQIAGDAIQPLTKAGIAATGMLVAGPWDAVQKVTPSKFGKLQSREEQLEEIVSAVSQTFLGLTVNCARCHDHKFDPILQTDYYQIKAVFEGVDHGLTPRVHGIKRLMGQEEERAWNEATQPLRTQIAGAEAMVDEIEKAIIAAKGDEGLTKELQTKRDSAKRELDERKKELATRYPVTMTFTGEREEPQPTVVFLRGDVKQPGQVVTPGGLSFLTSPSADLGLDSKSPEAIRRLHFANWLTHPDHPLTARILVNRVWQYHFGTGLVETPSDFGYNGSPPSHPELLDWLTAEFLKNGWSIKALHRTILNSATFRQASTASVENKALVAMHAKAAAVDAESRLLWRFPPRRLEGEVVRDSLLSFSGTLNSEIGGPSFKPFTTTQLNTYFYHLFDKDEPAYNRRSLYRMQIITGRIPLLDALDCPSPSITTPKRRPTTTPLQALALMNDSLVVRKADQLASRIQSERQSPTEQVVRAFEMVFARPPNEQELASCLDVQGQQGLATVCWALLNASEFLYLR